MSELTIDGDVAIAATSFTYRLNVSSGTHLAVVGPNGAGKSTLLRALAGLEHLCAGRLTHGDDVLDEPATATFVAPHQRSIALQPQDGALFPHLDVLDNVAFPLRARRVPRRAARSAAQEQLQRVGATDLAHQQPSALSGGEAARVALARSLAAGPDVLLLDEPAAALDVEARAELRRLITTLDQTVVTVTHDPLEARLLADRMAVISDGRVVQVGTADQVAESPATPWIAGFAGVNVVTGLAAGNEVHTDSGAILTLAERVDGRVHVAFPATAVALSAARPMGSARNVFEATITGLVADDDRVRVSFDAAFHANALITAAAATELALRPGGPVWASVKATELTVLPA